MFYNACPVEILLKLNYLHPLTNNDDDVEEINKTSVSGQFVVDKVVMVVSFLSFRYLLASYGINKALFKNV